MADPTLTLSDEARTRQEGAGEPTGAFAPMGSGGGGVEAPVGGLPPTSGTAPNPFGQVAEGLYQQDIGAAIGQWQEASKAAREATARRSATMAPVISQTISDVEGQMAVIPSPPPGPVLPPPPSRGIRGFLTPTDNEPPEASIMKLIQAVGLIAMGVGGAARGDFRSGLAALTGAMQGWAEGDKERADREFADWNAKTQTALKNWEIERTSYKDVIEAANLTLSQKFKLLELKALEAGNAEAAAAAEKKDIESYIGIMQKAQDSAAQIEDRRLKLVEMAENRRRDDERQAANDAWMREWKADEAKRQQANIEATREMQRGSQAISGQMAQARIADIERGAADRAERREERREGKPTPAGQLDNITALSDARTSVAEIKRLAPSVRMSKVTGGLSPMINEAIQTGKVGPIPIPEALKGVLGTLTPEEQRFLALASNYADAVLRLRSGAAVTDSEYRRMLGFLASPAVTADVFLSRLALEESLLARKDATLRDVLKQGGYRAPTVEAAPLGSGPKATTAPAPTMRFNPATGKLEKL